MNKKALIQGVYYVQFSGSNGKKVLWEVLEYRVVEEGKDYDEIGLLVFDFNLFVKEE